MPLEEKKSTLGKRILSGSDKSTDGSLLTRFVIWVWENPWFLKKLTTESAFSGISKWTYLEADRAASCENPSVFMWYETENGGWFVVLEM